MKGTVSICCFLSLLLLQATAGKTPKYFDQIFGGFLLFYVRWCSVSVRYVCVQVLLMNETVTWCKFRGWFNECAAAVHDCYVGSITQWLIRFRGCCSVVIQAVKMTRNNLDESRKYWEVFMSVVGGVCSGMALTSGDRVHRDSDSHGDISQG